MVKDMTTGNPFKLIIKFCIPLIIGNLFQQLYNVADTVIVGKFLGVDAFAAVGATGSLCFLFIGFANGMCSGFCIPVARYFGAEDYKSMRKNIINAFYLSVIMTVIITSFTLIFSKGILKLINTPENIFNEAYSYITVIFAGVGGTVFYNLLSGILRALGDSKTPLYFLIISSFVNIFLDIVFIAVFSTGVSGAAFATIISQILSGILCFIYIKKKFAILKIQPDEMKFDKTVSFILLKTGIPMALQMSIASIGSIIQQGAVNSLGSSAVASITAAGKIQSLVTQPMETIGVAMTTYCSQNLGAEKYDRIKEGIKKSVIFSMGYCIIAALLMIFIGQNISLIFIDANEIEILSNIKLYFYLTAPFYPVLGLLFIIRNSVQGLGFAAPTMAAGTLELITRVVFALTLVSLWKFPAACLVNPAAWISEDIILIPVYFYAMKKIKLKLCQNR